MPLNLRQMLTYDAWGNRAALRSLQATASRKGEELLGHIVAAERIWLARLVNQPFKGSVFPDADLERDGREIEALAGEWARYVEKADLDARIRYRSTKGESFENSAHEIAMHVLFHSAYHRGQIALVIRQGGAQPAVTDLIHCLRQDLL